MAELESDYTCCQSSVVGRRDDQRVMQNIGGQMVQRRWRNLTLELTKEDGWLWVGIANVW
jgi:hypothetical protein